MVAAARDTAQSQRSCESQSSENPGTDKAAREASKRGHGLPRTWRNALIVGPEEGDDWSHPGSAAVAGSAKGW